MPTISYPDLPENWEWWSENQTEAFYTRRFGTEDPDDGYEGIVYWDESQPHTISIFPILGIRDDGDPDVSEYPDATATYESKQDAVNAVPNLISEIEGQHSPAERLR